MMRGFMLATCLWGILAAMAIPFIKQADAAPQPKQWEVTLWRVPAWTFIPGDVYNTPPGWEPCGYDRGGTVLLRREVKP